MTLVPDAEWQIRCELAACYRLMEMFGWSDLINTRITARVPGAHDHFLINRFGMLYDEITASSLLKIDAAGKVTLKGWSVMLARNSASRAPGLSIVCNSPSTTGSPV